MTISFLNIIEEDTSLSKLPILNHYMKLVLFKGKQVVGYNSRDPKISADLRTFE